MISSAPVPQSGSLVFVMGSSTHLANAEELVPLLRRKGWDKIVGLDVAAFFYKQPLPCEKLQALFDVVLPIDRNSLWGEISFFSRIVSKCLRKCGWKSPATSLLRRAFFQKLAGVLDTVPICRGGVVFNDRFFPEKDAVDFFHMRRTPCFLVQESLRKDLQMNVQSGLRHGQGGCDRIFAWGETSRRYFLQVGVLEERIAVTGNPRFDRFRSACLQADSAAVREHWNLPSTPVVLLATNPVYAMNMKNALSREDCVETIRQVAQLAGETGSTVLWKPHPLEKDFVAREDVGNILRQFSSLHLEWDIPLSEAVAVAGRTLVFNSTVALESASCGRPVGLLALFEWEDGVEFVESGIACRISSPGSLRQFLASQDPLPGLSSAVSLYHPDEGLSVSKIVAGMENALSLNKGSLCK